MPQKRNREEEEEQEGQVEEEQQQKIPSSVITPAAVRTLQQGEGRRKGSDKEGNDDEITTSANIGNNEAGPSPPTIRLHPHSLRPSGNGKVQNNVMEQQQEQEQKEVSPKDEETTASSSAEHEGDEEEEEEVGWFARLDAEVGEDSTFGPDGKMPEVDRSASQIRHRTDDHPMNDPPSEIREEKEQADDESGYHNTGTQPEQQQENDEERSLSNLPPPDPKEQHRQEDLDSEASVERHHQNKQELELLLDHELGRNNDKQSVVGGEDAEELGVDDEDEDEDEIIGDDDDEEEEDASPSRLLQATEMHLVGGSAVRRTGTKVFRSGDEKRARSDENEVEGDDRMRTMKDMRSLSSPPMGLDSGLLDIKAEEDDADEAKPPGDPSRGTDLPVTDGNNDRPSHTSGKKIEKEPLPPNSSTLTHHPEIPEGIILSLAILAHPLLGVDVFSACYKVLHGLRCGRLTQCAVLEFTEPLFLVAEVPDNRSTLREPVAGEKAEEKIKNIKEEEEGDACPPSIHAQPSSNSAASIIPSVETIWSWWRSFITSLSYGSLSAEQIIEDHGFPGDDDLTLEPQNLAARRTKVATKAFGFSYVAKVLPYATTSSSSSKLVGHSSNPTPTSPAPPPATHQGSGLPASPHYEASVGDGGDGFGLKLHQARAASPALLKTVGGEAIASGEAEKDEQKETASSSTTTTLPLHSKMNFDQFQEAESAWSHKVVPLASVPYHHQFPVTQYPGTTRRDVELKKEEQPYPPVPINSSIVLCQHTKKGKISGLDENLVKALPRLQVFCESEDFSVNDEVRWHSLQQLLIFVKTRRSLHLLPSHLYSTLWLVVFQKEDQDFEYFIEHLGAKVQQEMTREEAAKVAKKRLGPKSASKALTQNVVSKQKEFAADFLISIIERCLTAYSISRTPLRSAHVLLQSCCQLSLWDSESQYWMKLASKSSAASRHLRRIVLTAYTNTLQLDELDLGGTALQFDFLSDPNAAAYSESILLNMIASGWSGTTGLTLDGLHSGTARMKVPALLRSGKVATTTSSGKKATTQNRIASRYHRFRNAVDHLFKYYARNAKAILRSTKRSAGGADSASTSEPEPFFDELGLRRVFHYYALPILEGSLCSDPDLSYAPDEWDVKLQEKVVPTLLKGMTPATTPTCTTGVEGEPASSSSSSNPRENLAALAGEADDTAAAFEFGVPNCAEPSTWSSKNARRGAAGSHIAPLAVLPVLESIAVFTTLLEKVWLPLDCADEQEAASAPSNKSTRTHFEQQGGRRTAQLLEKLEAFASKFCSVQQTGKGSNLRTSGGRGGAGGASSGSTAGLTAATKLLTEELTNLKIWAQYESSTLSADASTACIVALPLVLTSLVDRVSALVPTFTRDATSSSSSVVDSISVASGSMWTALWICVAELVQVEKRGGVSVSSSSTTETLEGSNIAEQHKRRQLNQQHEQIIGKIARMFLNSVAKTERKGEGSKSDDGLRGMFETLRNRLAAVCTTKKVLAAKKKKKNEEKGTIKEEEGGNDILNDGKERDDKAPTTEDKGIRLTSLGDLMPTFVAIERSSADFITLKILPFNK